MRRELRFLAIAATASTLAACGGLKEDLGLSKKAPDEFAVVRNAPLSLPPDYNLRPPKPGEIGDGRLEQRDQARALLVRDRGQNARTGAAATLAAASATSVSTTPVSYSFVAGRADGSPGSIDDYAFGRPRGAVAGPVRSGGPDRGETALLAKLDATSTDPNIRQRVDEEARLLAADDRNLVERMMFWRKLGPPGVVVNAPDEARRINENAALGQPVTEGETPEIRVERLSSGFSGIKLF